MPGKTILVGLALQFALAVFVLWVTVRPGRVQSPGRVVRHPDQFYRRRFQLFCSGPLADAESFGFVFAFQVLPTIIFFAALMACLYHLGIMQKLVEAMAWVMTPADEGFRLRIAGDGGPNVFVGQTEAPLVGAPVSYPA